MNSTDKTLELQSYLLSKLSYKSDRFFEMTINQGGYLGDLPSELDRNALIARQILRLDSDSQFKEFISILENNFDIGCKDTEKEDVQNLLDIYYSREEEEDQIEIEVKG